MAMNIPPWQQTSVMDPFEAEFSSVDVAIGGKLITAKLELKHMDQMVFATDDDYKRAIKMKVAQELARAMIETNVIEFTRVPHPSTLSDIIFARCYLAPDSQVKILRIEYANKK